MLGLDQSNAFEQIKNFIDGSDRMFTLTGGAGTGKTFLMKYIIDYCDDNNIPVIGTAPTNEAVKVIADKCDKAFNKTIYGIMGLVLKEENGQEPELNQEGNNTINNYELVIIDECSMIDDVLYKRLTRDMKLNKRYKILFVGDKCQLPPVSKGVTLDEDSAWTPNHIDEVSMSISEPDHQFELMEIHRQAIDNPIIRIATNFRTNLLEVGDHMIRESLVSPSGEVRFMKKKDEWEKLMIPYFTSDDFKLDDRHVKVLAYTNKEVDRLNAFIRPFIYGEDASEFEIGERIIAASTLVGKDEKRKGREVFKKDSDSMTIAKNERLFVEKAIKYAEPSCPELKMWKLTVRNIFGKSCIIETISRESLELFNAILGAIAHEAKTSGKAKGSWKQYYDLKNKYMTVKYAYAMTVHSAQGSTIKHVFVQESDMNKLTKNFIERNKLKYVAITRSAQDLYIYHR